jgi:uncharacterized tellurite resistance protein B-like protein
MSDTAARRAAFLYHFTQEVMLADQRLHKQEVTLLTELNPEMVAAGLMEPDGTLTGAYEAVLASAIGTLASALDEPDRRALLDKLLQAMAIDGDLDPKEWRVVHDAATALGLPPP